MTRAEGFTLLEVLVAFVVLSTILAAAYQTVSAGAQATQRAEARLEAVSAIESTLARLGADIPLRPGRRMAQAGGWTVALSIAPFAPADRPTWNRVGLTPYTVTATATRDGGAALSVTALKAAAP